MPMVNTRWLIIFMVLSLFSIEPLFAQTEKADESMRKDIQKEKGIDTSFSVSGGLGYNTNVYDAPTQNYTDYSVAAAPYVTVSRKSGMFIPLQFNAEGVKQSGKNRIIFSYDGKMDKYLGSVSNASTSKHVVKGALEMPFSAKGKLEDRVHLELFVTRNRETYTDHDTGAAKTTSTLGRDLSSRYTYDSTGLAAEYVQDTSDIRFGVRAEQETLDYARAGDGTEYDHVYTMIGGDVTIPLTETWRVNVDLQDYTRLYSSRHARDLSGTTSVAYPQREYKFQDLKTSFRYHPGKIWTLYLDYRRLDRTDTYVGYNDYTLQRYRARALFSFSDQIGMRLEAGTWNRVYPRALAFDSVTCGAAPCEKKYYDGKDGSLKLEYSKTKNLSYVLRMDLKDQYSSDPRYAFKRNTVQAEMTYGF